MQYEGDIIRPPSEADSILVQVATGCPHNRCTFCGAYRDRTFRVKPEATILQDLQWAARHFRHKRRLFLCDGDGMAIPVDRLISILQAVRLHLPWVTRIGMYASAQSVSRRTVEELHLIRMHGLSHVFMGLESGSDVILQAVGKAASAQEHITQAHRLHAADIKLSVSVILGLGGTYDASGENDLLRIVEESAPDSKSGSLTEERYGGMEPWKIHARATGEVLSLMQPQQCAALSLMLVPHTPLYDEAECGAFSLPDSLGLLKELRMLLEHVEMSRGLFLANHASNHLPLRVRLPKGKPAALAQLDEAIGGGMTLRPEWARGL